MEIPIYEHYCSQGEVMVAIKVKLQKRPGNKGKYSSIVITIPKAILDAAPKFQEADEAEMDVDSKENIRIKPVKK
jgi:antitoxin component of MazEF toxin-antitoxin module